MSISSRIDTFESVLLEALITLIRVAAYLHLGKGTAYRMASAGKLRASEVGSGRHLCRNDVDQWLEKDKNVRRGKSLDRE